ncbi:MAG: hypothetical protein ACLPI9_00745 [Halobacteriota archaeon]
MTQCKFCQHRDKLVLERKVIAGVITGREAAKRIGCSPSSITRHVRNHIAQVVRQDVNGDLDTRLALNVTAQLAANHKDVRTIIAQALKDGNNKLALKALETELKTLELSAKLQGQLDQRPTLNLLLDARYATLRETIIEKLMPYPEARLAVAEALEKIREAESEYKAEIDNEVEQEVETQNEVLDVEIIEGGNERGA